MSSSRARSRQTSRYRSLAFREQIAPLKYLISYDEYRAKISRRAESWDDTRGHDWGECVSGELNCISVVSRVLSTICQYRDGFGEVTVISLRLISWFNNYRAPRAIERERERWQRQRNNLKSHECNALLPVRYLLQNTPNSSRRIPMKTVAASFPLYTRIKDVHPRLLFVIRRIKLFSLDQVRSVRNWGVQYRAVLLPREAMTVNLTPKQLIFKRYKYYTSRALAFAFARENVDLQRTCGCTASVGRATQCLSTSD